MKTLILLLSLCSFIFASNISIIKVEKMHCPLCTIAVKKAIKQVNGIEKVSVRLNTKEAKVIYTDNVKLEDILVAIKTTSYEGIVLSTSKYKK